MVHFPAKTQVPTEHKKHYRTLEAGPESDTLNAFGQDVWASRLGSWGSGTDCQVPTRDSQLL